MSSSFLIVVAALCFAHPLRARQVHVSKLTETESLALIEYADSVAAKTDLATSAVLLPSSTVEDLVRDQYKNPSHQLVLGIRIKNYSKYKLVDPQTSENANCAYNTEVSYLKIPQGET